MRPTLAWQGSFFDEGPAKIDASYADLRRVQLDDECWVDRAPGWLSGSDSLFAELLASGRWEQRSLWIYDELRPEPRLTAGWSPEDGARAEDTPEALNLIARSLSERYSVDFDRIWVNLYRDGRDSVAWHRDRNHRVMRNPLVATVSVGNARRFLMRPRGGRVAHEFRLGHGDLLVMGGATQHAWEHTVPKAARALGPRISVTLRHTHRGPTERPGRRSD
jgi:alkylated DNA repair dioxygenase AlkB